MMTSVPRPDTETLVSIVTKYEEEIVHLSKTCGIDSSKFPLHWVRWESEFKDKRGIRAPSWRVLSGDIGYILASSHDSGIVTIVGKTDGTCQQVKGYKVGEEAGEEMDYSPVGGSFGNLTELLKSASRVFASLIDTFDMSEVKDFESKITEEEITDSVKLPTPILDLKEPLEKEKNVGNEKQEPDDDEPPMKPIYSGDEFTQLLARLINFRANFTSEPGNRDLQDIVGNDSLRKILRTPQGLGAIERSSVFKTLMDSLRQKQSLKTEGQQRESQIKATIDVFVDISSISNIREKMVKEDIVKYFIELLKKDDDKIMNDLFDAIANCCKNKKFRETFLERKGIELYSVPLQKYTEKCAYTLWTLNRSEQATRDMIACNFKTTINNKLKENGSGLMLNLTRLLYSMAYYGDPDQGARKLEKEQLDFFIRGLGCKDNPELLEWAARAFTIFELSEENVKAFCDPKVKNSNEKMGPSMLVDLLDPKNFDVSSVSGKKTDADKKTDAEKKIVNFNVNRVILSGLETLSVLCEIPKIRDTLTSSKDPKETWDNLTRRISELWKHQDIEIRKKALKLISILAKNGNFCNWTTRNNMIPKLMEYLDDADFELVINSAKAIGSICAEPGNLKILTDKQHNGVRKLWSLMNSPSSGVKAAATRALVPFLKSKEAPSEVRRFVNGLEILVGLLHLKDPEVQAAACEAVSEIAKDKENLGVMTDLGIVELLSNLLKITKHDHVKRPLANAIEFAANYGDNRARFGAEEVIDPLVSYLKPPSMNTEVHAATAKALKVLSEEQNNSKKLSQNGVVDYLLKMVENQVNDSNNLSDDAKKAAAELQMASAIAIRNIRSNRE